VTDAAGRYSIADVAAGTYPRFRAISPAGYAGDISGPFTVPGSGTVTRDFHVSRNYASGPGGANIRSAAGETSFCPVNSLIDDDHKTSWSTVSPSYPYAGGPKSVVVRLPADITVTRVAIDPSPGCFFFGTVAAAALADYRVKVARDDEDDPGPSRRSPAAGSGWRTSGRRTTSR